LGQAGFFYGKAIKIRFLQSKNPVNPVYPVKKDILRSEILKNMLVIFSQDKPPRFWDRQDFFMAKP
jgi:hypothetical protein